MAIRCSIVDIFYSATALVAGEDDDYFFMTVYALSSNMTNVLVEYVARCSARSTNGCVKCLGQCCVCACCCYMLLAAIGQIALSSRFCSTPPSLVVSNGVVPEPGGVEWVDLSATYKFDSWMGDKTSCEDEDAFATWRSGSTYLFYKGSLAWGSDAMAPSSYGAGYWVFGSSIDEPLDPRGSSPNSFAVSADAYYGPGSARAQGQPPSEDNFMSSCPSEGCWRAYDTSLASFDTYGVQITVQSGGAFDALFLIVVGRVIFLWAIIHVQGWFIWFAWGIPVFLYKFNKDRRRIHTDLQTKETEMVVSGLVPGVPL